MFNFNKFGVIYFLSFIFYFFQVIYYSGSTLLSNLSLFFIFLVGFFYFIKSYFVLVKPKGLTLLNIVIVLIFLSYLLTGEHSDLTHFNQFKNILFFIFPLYVVYFMTSESVLKEKEILIFFYLSFPVLVFLFFNQTITLKNQIGRDEITNNLGYFFPALFPFLFLIKKQWLGFILVCFLLVLTILSAKRGSFILMSVNFLIFFIFIISKLSRGKLFFFFSCLFIFIFLTYSSFLVFFENSFLLTRIQENFSTRPENYSSIFFTWVNSERFLNLLIGYGFFSSPNYNPEGTFAHNDWLEVLIDFGFLGFCLYLLFFILGCFYFFRIKERNYKFAFFSILVSWLFISIFSMWIINPINIFYTVFLGYLIGRNNFSRFSFNNSS